MRSFRRELPRLTKNINSCFGMGDLALCLLESISGKQLQARLKILGEQLREHMNSEEEMMFEVGCLSEVMIEHAKDHQLFLHHLYEACKEEMTLDELRVFLRYMNFWMRFHVLTIDKPVRFQIPAIQAGVSPRDAYLQSVHVAEQAMPILQAGMHKTYADLYDLCNCAWCGKIAVCARHSTTCCRPIRNLRIGSRYEPC